MSEPDYRAVIADLLGAWEQYGQPHKLSQPEARRGKAISNLDVARMACVVGLARHVHETARSIQLLLDSQHVNSAVPLTRLMYECALTSVWLVQSKDGDGVKAFLHEHARNNRNLQKNLRTALSATFRENADSIADTDVEPFIGSKDSVRRFDQICGDLSPGGDDAYVFYRALSSLSHASLSVSDLYYERPPGDTLIPSYRESAGVPFEPKLLRFFSASSMVWSGRAVSYMTKSRDYRSVLRNSARLIGVSAEIKLSNSYHERHARARRAAKAEA